ncbi:MAG: hypoxanthine phosphoribosyltransferase [Chitinophagales bacterium]|nr:hypoxanthine phosphoribosyltransferase [Chitinophagales bacterium]
MEVITLQDLNFRSFIPAHVIRDRISEMATRMNVELEHEFPLFIGVLNGAFMFAANLLKDLTITCEVTFVKLSSYDGTRSTHDIKTLIGLDKDISGRTIVILEDIVDSGTTLREFIPTLKILNPRRVLIATLLLKPEALEHYVEMQYIGFEVPNQFLVGFGLDYNGLGRNLKDIYVRC